MERCYFVALVTDGIVTERITRLAEHEAQSLAETLCRLLSNGSAVWGHE